MKEKQKLEEKELLKVTGGSNNIRYCWQADGKKDECKRPQCTWNRFKRICVDNSDGYELSYGIKMERRKD